METPAIGMWHEPRNFVYSAPPVLDIATDMVGAVPKWSTADMDFLIEVNDDSIEQTETKTEIQPETPKPVSTETCPKETKRSNVELDWVIEESKASDKTEPTTAADESVYISRQDLVNSESGLCVKPAHDTADDPAIDITQNTGAMQNYYLPSYEYNPMQYETVPQGPYINYTANCQYGYVQPQTFQYIQPMPMYQQNVDLGVVDQNMGYQYQYAYYPPQVQYNTVYYTDGLTGTEYNPIAHLDTSVPNPNIQQYTTVPEIERLTDEGKIDTSSSDTCMVTGQLNEEDVSDAVENDANRSEKDDKPELVNNLTDNFNKPVPILEGCDTSTNNGKSVVDNENANQTLNVNIQNTNSSFEPVPHEIQAVEVNFAEKSCAQPNTPQNANIANNGNNIHTTFCAPVPAPFNPRVPPPSLFPPVNQPAPPKQLLFNQPRRFHVVPRAAEATAPSGYKFYIPLDATRYEIKKSNHDLYDIPEGCTFHEFKNEGNFESCVRLTSSPRPVQFKGSLSDDDGENSSVSGDSETSRTTEMSANSSDSESSMVNVPPGPPLDECIPGYSDMDTREKAAHIANKIKQLISVETDEVVNLKAKQDDKNIIQENVSLNDDSKVDNNKSPETDLNDAGMVDNDDVGDTKDKADKIGSSNAPDPIDESDCSKVVANQEVSVTSTQDSPRKPVTMEINGEEPQNIHAILTQHPAMQPYPDQDVQQWYTMPVPIAYMDPQHIQQQFPVQYYDSNGLPTYCQDFATFTPNTNEQFIVQPFTPTIPAAASFPSVYNTNQITPEPIAAAKNDPKLNIPEELIDPEDGLPYPALHISDDGLISVILRHGVYVEMTPDKAIRVVNHEKKMVVALNDTGNKACVIHPAAKVYQCDANVDVDLSLNRKAKMTSECIVFGNSFKTYKFDNTVINEVPDFSNFRCLNEDLSVGFLDTNTGFFTSDALLRCTELISRSYFEKKGENGCKVILNGSKIVQTDNGEVTVFSGTVRYMRMNPSTDIVRLRTHLVEIDIETNWSLKLQRGTQTLNSSHLGFILSNGKIKASIDQKNKMDAFSLPFYKRLTLGQPMVHRRPGVSYRRRRNMYYNTRYEPEFDHRAYYARY